MSYAINRCRPQPLELAKKQRRFFVLDGLRGIAAIAVMIFHTFPALPSNIMSHGYLAVDFFFLLSGFVIAMSYESKLTFKMSLRRFLVIRIIRLYPLAIAAIISAAFLRIIYPRFTFPDVRFVYDFVMNIFLLPNSLSVTDEKFVFLPPSWSLFCEMIVNVAYAALIPHISKFLLISIVVISGLLLTFLILQEGSVHGLYQNLGYGIVRTIFSFSMGVTVFRYFYSKYAFPKIPKLIIYLFLAGILLVPVGIVENSIYDLVSLSVFFPSVLLASIAHHEFEFSPIENELGELSYPIYLLHMPVAAYAGVALGWMIGGFLLEISAALITVATAALAWRFYDRPVRSWLSRRFLARDTQVSTPGRP